MVKSEGLIDISKLDYDHMCNIEIIECTLCYLTCWGFVFASRTLIAITNVVSFELPPTIAWKLIADFLVHHRREPLEQPEVGPDQDGLLKLDVLEAIAWSRSSLGILRSTLRMRPWYVEEHSVYKLWSEVVQRKDGCANVVSRWWHDVWT
jgi:hypothetical protein